MINWTNNNQELVGQPYKDNNFKKIYITNTKNVRNVALHKYSTVSNIKTLDS